MSTLQVVTLGTRTCLRRDSTKGRKLALTKGQPKGSFFLPGLASLEADVCRELGIRLVDGLGEKVQSSWGTQGSMPSMHSGLQESRGRAAALFYHMSSSFWAHDFQNTTPSWDK